MKNQCIFFVDNIIVYNSVSKNSLTKFLQIINTFSQEGGYKVVYKNQYSSYIQMFETKEEIGKPYFFNICK